MAFLSRCWSRNLDDGGAIRSGGTHGASRWPTGLMACFKRTNTTTREDEDAKRMSESLLDDQGDRSDRSGIDKSITGDRFTKGTSSLVRQASKMASEAQKQQRLSRESKISSLPWNILRRQSNVDQDNPADQGKSIHTTRYGRAVSPRLSLDSERRVLRIRRDSRVDDANAPAKCAIPRGRMSIVAKDWDAVRKVHDPESDVGGVYVGEEAGRGKSTTSNGEYQTAFTAMKISESTEHTLSMIDD